MAIDLSKVQSRLAALKTTGSKSTHLWKPESGKQVIRIVPSPHSPDNPFFELYFHYGINGKNYVSPASFDRPDPIVEFANKLKQSKDKDEWKRGRALEPKLRTYMPIIVRGKESEGIKFWGVGKQIFQEILTLIADEDYGDITDLKAGRDITVTFKTKEEAGKDFPETTILVKPNQSPAFDLKDPAMQEKWKNQKKITELFPEPTYEELEAAFDAYLNAPETDESEEAPATQTKSSKPNKAAPAEDVASDEEEVTPKKTEKVESATTKAAVKPASNKSIASEFEDLFNEP